MSPSFQALKETDKDRPSQDGGCSMKRPRTTRLQRSPRRRGVGNLETLLISKRTQTLCDKSLVAFMQWLKTESFAWPDSVDFLGQRLGEFVKSCWEDGDTRALPNNLISHILLVESILRTAVGWAKRLMAAWQKHELPNRSFPLTRDMILAMAGLGVHWTWLDIAAALLTGFKGLLRLQELLEIRCADMTHNAAMGKILLSIPDSTTGTKSVTWSIRGQDCVFSLVLVLKEDRMPGDFLFDLTAA